MARKKDLLQKLTFKEDGMEMDRRVFYTLTDRKEMQAHRTAKAVALLVRLLHEKKMLTEKEIDQLLLDCSM